MALHENDELIVSNIRVAHHLARVREVVVTPEILDGASPDLDQINFLLIQLVGDYILDVPDFAG